MPNRPTHIKGGIATSLLTHATLCAINKEDITLKDIAAKGFIGFVGGVLPDILEPATSPNHRKFFHSVLWIGIVGFALYKLWEHNEIDDDTKKNGTALGASYLSHLAMDSMTPKGLPLF